DDDEIGFELCHAHNAVDSVGGRLDIVARKLEYAAEYRALVGVVVDDEEELFRPLLALRDVPSWDSILTFSGEDRFPAQRLLVGRVRARRSASEIVVRKRERLPLFGARGQKLLWEGGKIGNRWLRHLPERVFEAYLSAPDLAKGASEDGLKSDLAEG